MSEKNEKIVEKSWTDPITGKFTLGNPGKPKGATHKKKLIDELEELLAKMVDGKDYTLREALMKKIIAKMIIDGDTRLITEYWQQKDGKPKQPLVGGEEGDNPISILSNANLFGNNRPTQDSSTDKAD